MYIKLILLITFAIINAQDDVSSSRMETDAENYVDLYLKYIQRSPSGSVRSYNTISCQIVRECCPEKRDDLYNIITENKLVDKCIKPSSTGSQTSKCKRLIQSWYDLGKRGSVYLQYLDALGRTQEERDRGKQRRSFMGRVCSKRELEAYYCEPEDRTLLLSCATKILRLVDREQDGNGYDRFVRDFKTDFKNNYDALRTTFP